MSSEPSYFYLFYRTDRSKQRDYASVCEPVLSALARSPARNYFTTIVAKDPLTGRTSPYVHTYGIRKIPTIVTDQGCVVGPEDCLAFIEELNMETVKHEQATVHVPSEKAQKTKTQEVVDVSALASPDMDGQLFVPTGERVNLGSIEKSEGVDVATTMSIAEKLEAIKKASKDNVATRPKFGLPKIKERDA